MGVSESRPEHGTDVDTHRSSPTRWWQLVTKPDPIPAPASAPDPEPGRKAPFRLTPNWSPEVIGSTLILTGTILTSYYFWRRNLRRIGTVAEIPFSCLTGRRTLFGRVTGVGDGDNFRFFHTPGGRWLGWGFFRKVPDSRKALTKAGTIHVRLAGVDAPEAAHFGNPAQPYSKEALDWLTKQLLCRPVRIKLWAKDRYDRVVASVKVRTWLGQKDVSLEMVKAGLATVYLQQGAEYGGIKDKLDRAEYIAKLRRRGMWRQSKRAYQSPAEYKRKYANSSGASTRARVL